MRTGLLKGDDILKQEQSTATRTMMQKFLGGSGGPAGMELQGVKIGPSGEIMPDFGQTPVTSPQTVQTPDGPRLRTYNPRTGSMVADLGAGKEENVAPEAAGRISGLVQAQGIVQDIRGKFIDPETGQVNRTLVMTSFGKVPKTQGRQVRNDLGIALDAVVRARTGSGLNAQELKDLVEQFVPSPLDGDPAVIQKMDRLEQFIGGALDVVTLPASLKKRITQTPTDTGGWKIEPVK
jgi:hypothetical protein